MAGPSLASDDLSFLDDNSAIEGSVMLDDSESAYDNTSGEVESGVIPSPVKAFAADVAQGYAAEKGGLAGMRVGSALGTPFGPVGRTVGTVGGAVVGALLAGGAAEIGKRGLGVESSPTEAITNSLLSIALPGAKFLRGVAQDAVSPGAVKGVIERAGRLRDKADMARLSLLPLKDADYMLTKIYSPTGKALLENEAKRAVRTMADDGFFREVAHKSAEDGYRFLQDRVTKLTGEIDNYVIEFDKSGRRAGRPFLTIPKDKIDGELKNIASRFSNEFLAVKEGATGKASNLTTAMDEIGSLKLLLEKKSAQNLSKLPNATAYNSLDNYHVTLGDLQQAKRELYELTKWNTAAEIPPVMNESRKALASLVKNEMNDAIGSREFQMLNDRVHAYLSMDDAFNKLQAQATKAGMSLKDVSVQGVVKPLLAMSFAGGYAMAGYPAALGATAAAAGVSAFKQPVRAMVANMRDDVAHRMLRDPAAFALRKQILAQRLVPSAIAETLGAAEPAMAEEFADPVVSNMRERIALGETSGPTMRTAAPEAVPYEAPLEPYQSPPEPVVPQPPMMGLPPEGALMPSVDPMAQPQPMPTPLGDVQDPSMSLTPSVASTEMPQAAPKPVVLPRTTEGILSAPPEAFMDLPPEMQDKVRDMNTLPEAMQRQLSVELMQAGILQFEDVPHPWLKGYSVIDDRIVDPGEIRALSEDFLERERDGKLSLLDSSKLRSALHSRKPVVELIKQASPQQEGPSPEKVEPKPAQEGVGDSKRMSYDF